MIVRLSNQHASICIIIMAPCLYSASVRDTLSWSSIWRTKVWKMAALLKESKWDETKEVNIEKLTTKQWLNTWQIYIYSDLHYTQIYLANLIKKRQSHFKDMEIMLIAQVCTQYISHQCKYNRRKLQDMLTAKVLWEQNVCQKVIF